MLIVIKLEHVMMVCKKIFYYCENTILYKLNNVISKLLLKHKIVAVHCKDTRIAVQVRTNKPFNGRIYALGRSETCNIDVLNSDAFRLDLTMGGQDCNTQSIVSVCSQSIFLNIT